MVPGRLWGMVARGLAGVVGQTSTMPDRIGPMLNPDTNVRAVVLLVDDQAMVAEDIRRMLADESDIEFHYCSNPRKAINTATEINASLILLELDLKAIDGKTLMRFFRANPSTREIPVILLSFKDDPKIRSDVFANGANDYIVMMPDKIELIARIRTHAYSYLTQQHRDAAFHSLLETQKVLEESNSELRRQISLLQNK